ncbi:PadR family transcriptional regulator [Halobaculum sp. P14]|uniref:PadR family transcriptional regulator n=1 Tax=Halobaculum sp. P14 TaxID=3421638 RepID=UPI003EBCBD31
MSSTLADTDAPTWTDLTAFEGNTLYAVAALEADSEPTYGLAVKRVLSDLYGQEINHGRLYPTLDGLDDAGLLEKSELDSRTNRYELTDVGRDLLRDRLRQLSDAVNGGDSA